MMAVCSYLVLTRPGARERAADRLASLPGCEVIRSDNRDALILVTTTAGGDADAALSARLDAVEDVECVVMAFGEIDAPDAGGPHAA